MSYLKKSAIAFGLLFAFGAVLMVLHVAGVFPDTLREGAMIGIGSGFLVTGLLGVAYCLVLMRDPQRARRIEVAKTDERTQLIQFMTYSQLHRMTVIVESLGAVVVLSLGYLEVAVILAAWIFLRFLASLALLGYYSRQL